MNESVNLSKSSRSVRFITRVGILSALAFVFMLFEFPLVFLFPDFLKIDFSDTIAMIGGVALGPIAAIFIELIKNFLKIFQTTTGGIGELANFLVGVGFVVPIALVYRKVTNNKGLILGMLLGTISMVVVASLANYFILLPLWMPGAPGTDRMNMIITLLIPFNLVKAVLESIVGFIAFNGIKGLLKHIKLPKN